MAKQKTIDDHFHEFMEGIYADGTFARWENERKEKKVKQLIRKVEKRLRLQEIINETLEKLEKNALSERINI
jgi:hypothetical protein